jgi:hypothetical protein
MNIKFMRLLGFLIISSLSVCSQTTISLFPLADAEINQGGGGSFAGSSSVFQISPWTPSFSKRAVIKFNLAPYGGCTINSAWLVLMEYSTNTTSRQINVHRLTTSWSENSTHWITPWITSGGDYEGSVLNSFTPTWTGVIKKDSVNLTSAVQSFANGTYTNHGWLLKISSEDASQQYWAFYSKEAAAIINRPILRIRYSGCTPLPIELLNFDVQLKANGQVQLIWQTASEVNNDFFTVEKSADAIDWNELKQIDGAGNSTAILNYTTMDEHPYADVIYYRLKQTDFDGHFSYSIIKAITINQKNIPFQIYPNPAQDQIVINCSRSELFQLKIYNILGQDVTDQTRELKNEETTRTIEVKNLNAGIYYIHSETAVGILYKQ